jgi:hypothetical protein
LHNKFRYVRTFLGWSQWITSNEILVFRRRCRRSHHVYILFCSFAQCSFGNAGWQNWNAKVYFDIWLCLVLGSPAHSLFCNWVDAQFLHIFGLFDAWVRTEHLCKLRTVECLDDCEKEDIGDSVWDYSDVRKCSFVFFPIDIRRLSGRKVAVSWGLHRRRDFLHKCRNFRGNMLIGHVHFP